MTPGDPAEHDGRRGFSEWVSGQSERHRADPTGADRHRADPTGADRHSADPTGADWHSADPTGADWHSDELVGLDPEDPEAQQFAAHLARMRRDRPGFTVEGYLDGVTEFADSANRAGGGRRLGAVVLVVLLLVVAGFLIWEAALFIVTTWL